MPYESAIPPFNFADGAAYATSVTLTDVSPTPNINTRNLPPFQLGTILRLKAWWRASNTGTPTLTSGFYYGGVAGVALAATTAVTTTTAMTAWTWYMEYIGIIRSLGASGTILGMGRIEVPTSLTAMTPRRIPETALATVTIDTTVGKDLTLGLTWGTSSGSNTATDHGMTAEVLNVLN